MRRRIEKVLSINGKNNRILKWTVTIQHIISDPLKEDGEINWSLVVIFGKHITLESFKPIIKSGKNLLNIFTCSRNSINLFKMFCYNVICKIKRIKGEWFLGSYANNRMSTTTIQNPKNVRHEPPVMRHRTYTLF